MSHTHKIVQSRHNFQKGLLAFIRGDVDAGLRSMHAALAPIIMLQDDPAFFRDATYFIETVQCGALDGHMEYAKRTLPIIEKQLRNIQLHGSHDDARTAALRRAISVADSIGTEAFSVKSDALHDFSEFWNNGEDDAERIEKYLSAMHEEFSGAPDLVAAVDAIRTYLDTRGNAYDRLITQSEALANGIDMVTNDDLKIRMDVAICLVVMQEHIHLPSIESLAALRKLPDMLFGQGELFSIVNATRVWRQSWRAVSDYAKTMLTSAAAALDAFDTEGAERQYQMVSVIVSPFVLVKNETVSHDAIRALLDQLQDRATISTDVALTAIDEYLSGFSSPMTSDDLSFDGVQPAQNAGTGTTEFDFSFDIAGPSADPVSADPVLTMDQTPQSEVSDETPSAVSASPLNAIDSAEDIGSSNAPCETGEASITDAVQSDQDEKQDVAADNCVDPEMLSIFIDEAKEVLTAMRSDIESCRIKLSTGDVREPLSSIRRGVHTLKGSSRMVGQNALGEIAWSVEAVLNKILDEDRKVDAVLLDIMLDFSNSFLNWVDELETSGSSDIAGGKELVDRIEALETHTEQIESEEIKTQVEIGGLSIAVPLFNIAKSEMQKHVAVMIEQAHNLHAGDNAPIAFEFARSAHTLAGVSRTTGLTPIGELASALEDWLKPRQENSFWMGDTSLDMVMRTVDALDVQVSEFIEHRMPDRYSDLCESLRAEEQKLSKMDQSVDQSQITIVDISTEFVQNDIDVDLLPIFIEEAAALEDEIGEALRMWKADVTNSEAPRLLMRLLHTMKGSARMVGAMHIGEIAHRLEDELRVVDRTADRRAVIDDVESGFDDILTKIDGLVNHEVQHKVSETAVVDVPIHSVVTQNHLKVPVDVLDILVNESGEIGSARQRIESEMYNLQSGLREMDKGVDAMKRHLRDIEIHAESQMQSRVALNATADEHFDPLEFDRFTRLQEITRFMNESIFDVQTVRHALLSGLNDIQSALNIQQKLNREHQYRLTGIRMTPFASISERLYRVCRQTAKDLGKRVNLDIIGGGLEIDAVILEKMTAPIEHLLRNCIAHGIESDRALAGKDLTGEIVIEMKYENGEIVVSVRDDGAGINVGRLREKALAIGAISADANLSPEELVDLVFLPGLSTAHELTEVAGRGVGMDIVKTTIESMGGRIDINTRTGGGTKFTCRLPTVVSMMHVMMVKSAEEVYAIPSMLIASVLHVEPKNMTTVMNDGKVMWREEAFVLHSLSQIMESGSVTRDESAPTQFLLMRSSGQNIALQVDEVISQGDVSVKRLGSQFSGFSGVQGGTILGSGQVVLIVDPAALIDNKQKSTFVTTKIVNPVRMRPLVMVVDDSLTVRKVSARFLEANGYDVTTATDGQDALAKLEDVDPDVMLLDIEMPRMNGFELAESLRASDRFKNLPIVMITSRTADKHREHAMALGVNHYMGKPFKESVLLDVLTGYRGNIINAVQPKESEYA